MRKYAIVLFFLFLILCRSIQAQFHWRTGETLTYKVKWAFVRLGTITLTITDSTMLDTIPVHHIKFFIHSNPMLFFVNMNSAFDCYLDNKFRPIKYIASETDHGIKKWAVYHFYYADSIFTIAFHNAKDSSKIRHVVLPLKQNVYDGISLVFYARSHIQEKRSEDVTAFWEDRLGKVTLNFKGKAKAIKIEAWPEEIPTYYIDGTFHLKGIAGVTGPFKGWFARDGQRPPLKAYLKVFVGNVVAELIEWKRWDKHPALNR